MSSSEEKIIEHLKELDSIGRISAEIRIDSNSHYLIKGQDTSQIILNKYSTNNLLIEKVNHQSIGRTANTWYKILYYYDSDNKLMNKTTTNINDQPLRIINYTYKNGLIVSEQNVSYTIFESKIKKKKESIKYNYEFY